MNVTSHLHIWSANQSGNFVPSVLSVLLWIKLHKCLPLMLSTKEETNIHLGNWICSLFTSSFAQSNTLDEIRNDSYIIHFYMLWTFSYVSWHSHLKLFQVQTSYRMIEVQMGFHSNNTYAHNIQQIEVYCAHQPKITTWYMIRNDKEVDRNLIFQECTLKSQCAKPNARTL